MDEPRPLTAVDRIVYAAAAVSLLLLAYQWREHYRRAAAIWNADLDEGKDGE